MTQGKQFKCILNVKHTKNSKYRNISGRITLFHLHYILLFIRKEHLTIVPRLCCKNTLLWNNNCTDRYCRCASQRRAFNSQHRKHNPSPTLHEATINRSIAFTLAQCLCISLHSVCSLLHVNYKKWKLVIHAWRERQISPDKGSM